MKKKAVLVLIASSMVLSGCWFTDMFKKWFKKEPDKQQNEDNKPSEKTIVSIISVNAPTQIEQGQTLSSVQLVVGYSDGSTGTVSSTSVTLDTSAVGTATGTASVGGVSATFTIEVTPNYPTHHGIFTVSNATAGQGYTDLTLTNASSDSIKVHAQKVSISGENIVAEKNSYFVIYNDVNSPLNDVNDIALSWNHSPALLNSESLGYSLYFSYNFLTLDDIFAGYYKDLDTNIGSFSVNGTNGTFSSYGCNEIGSHARYFLAVIQTPSSDMLFTGLSITSVNSEKPEAVEKGMYAYPEGYANMFPGFDSGFPYIGNGSLEWSVNDNLASFVSFQREAKYNWLIQQLTANGFVYATELYGMDVYQKPYNSSQSYTYAITKVEITDFEIISLTNAGLYQNLIEVASWPGDELKAAITNTTYKNYITDPQFTGNVAYIVNTESEGSENSGSVLVTNKETNLRDQVVANATILKNYLHAFVTNYGFTVSSEYDGDFTQESFSYFATIKSPDMKFEVSTTIVYQHADSLAMMSLEFKEYIFGPFPTAQVRGLFDDDSFPALVSASGEYSYKLSSNGEDLKLTGLGLTKAELDTYYSTLREYGFNVNDSQYSNYHYYGASKLVVNNEGAFNYSVTSYLYENYVTITFSKRTNSGNSSFGDAVYKLASKLRDDLVTALGEEFCSGNFVVDSTNKIVYAMGYSSAEAQQLLGVCTFDSTLNGYYFFVNDSTTKGAVKISVDTYSNYLAIHMDYINSSLWNNYHFATLTTTPNDLIDGLFEYAGRTDASTYYLGSTNSVKFARSDYSFDIYAYGTNVASVIESYQTLLLSNSDIKYSAYLNQYINTSTEVGITFDMHDTEAIPYVVIRFSFYNDFIDYRTYSEIASELTSFTHLSSFTSLDVLGANEAGFVVSGVYESSLYLNLSEQAYNAYKAAVEADTRFTEINTGFYEYVDSDGNRSMISFYSYSYSVSLTYESLYYTTIDAIKADYDANSFSFYENYVIPTQAGKIFKSGYHSDTYFEIQYAKGAFDKDAYVTQLIKGGFKESRESSTQVIYCKVVGHISYIVEIVDTSIYYRTATYDDLVSYAEVIEYAETYDFESVKFDNFVTIDGMENNYYRWSASRNEVMVLISNSSVTQEAYVTALLNAGYTEDTSKPGYYNKGTSTVYTYTYCGFLVISYRDERIIYKSFSEVLAKAVSAGFESWRLDHVLVPSQTGNIYSLSYAWSQTIEFYYDPDVFDVNAYKAELVEAGYNGSGNSYSKGDASVYISTGSHYISLSYSGTNS